MQPSGERQTWYRMAILAGCLGITAIIGGIRYVTGPELALSLFYLLPVYVATWHIERWAGLLVSVSAALTWLAADYAMIRTFSHPVIPFINETFRLIVFLLLTWIIWKLKTALNEQKALARTDVLTQTANRRAFQELAGYELKKARRYGYPLSVLYLDLDHFKLMNDRYGHQMGDELLRQVSRHIQSSIREIDILARMGGDEFCVLLIDSHAKSAYWVADKLRLRIMQLMQNRNWPVAVSIGAATFLTLPESVEELIGLADQLMYLAKKDKQGRIVQKIFTDPEQPIAERHRPERHGPERHGNEGRIHSLRSI